MYVNDTLRHCIAHVHLKTVWKLILSQVDWNCGEIGSRNEVMDDVMCGRGGPLGDYAMGNNFDQILAHLAAQHEPQATPTDQHVRETLPQVKISSASTAAGSAAGAAAAAAPGSDCPPSVASVKAGDTCAVCHDEFEEGMELSSIPGCLHCFHGACIQPWLEQVRQPHSPSYRTQEF